MAPESRLSHGEARAGGVLAYCVRLLCEGWGSWAHEAGAGLGLGRLGWRVLVGRELE